MESQQLDLGVVRSLEAEAIGEPGRRTFRLVVQTTGGTVLLWLEKEQVVMLGSAVDELLQRVPETRGQHPESDALGSFSGELEVKVGSLAVGYDADHGGFSVEAGDFESPFALTAISFLASRAQFGRLGEQIREIVAAGRPRCSLCGTPLTGGPHFCPQSNGHGQFTIPE